MTGPDRLLAADAGHAAVEMALVLPLLLALLFGSVELGNYFYNEHILIKAVRDGARYAARQDMSNFTNCSTPGGSVVADTQNVVKTGLLSGGTDRMPFTGATINVTVTCTKNAGSTPLAGIYTNVVDNSGAAVGAPVVSIEATVPYTSLLKSFGFTGVGYNLHAKQQAAVAGW
jgi:Flp pilus assembly protein TadG